jgi:predicted GIY-YIG superfamily endonuclease
MFYFYILRCKDRTLYCGSTNNLDNRVKLHNTGRGSVYVRSRGGGRIVYAECFQTKSESLRREAEVKKWSKAKKEELISKARTLRRKPPGRLVE